MITSCEWEFQQLVEMHVWEVKICYFEDGNSRMDKSTETCTGNIKEFSAVGKLEVEDIWISVEDRTKKEGRN